MLGRWRLCVRNAAVCRSQSKPSALRWSTSISVSSPECSNARPRNLLWHRPFSDQPRWRRKDVVPVNDTIYALSTGTGKAAIAVIRVSGPACLDIYGALCPDRPFPAPRKATVRKLFDPDDDDRTLDSAAVVLYFPGPRSVTGEDILELHIHGGPATVRAVLEAIPRCFNARSRRRPSDYSRIRMAEPGEFTKRAFYNGRIDLTRAEALGATLAAETEQQRRLATAGSGTTLKERYESWRKQLLHARGELEALIDFSEDQHFDESFDDLVQSVSAQVRALQRQIVGHMQNADRGELLRNGIDVALLGAPNAGKSSFLNLIVGREAAIVSNEAGTTRDIVDVNIDMGGWLMRLGDTAGLRADRSSSHGNPTGVLVGSNPPIGSVELEGIRRARNRATQADLVIAIVALKWSADGEVDLDLNEEVTGVVAECHRAGKAVLLVVNKIDLVSTSALERLRDGIMKTLVSALAPTASTHVFFVSCKEASAAQHASERGPAGPLSPGPALGGLRLFLDGLTATFAEMTTAVASEDTTMTMSAEDAQAYWNASLSVTQRQQAHLRDCSRHLHDYLTFHYSSPGEADSSTTVGSGAQPELRHGVDDRHALVGDVVKVIDTRPSKRGSGLTDDYHVSSTVADTEDHPSASAEHPLGGCGSPAGGLNREFDVVHAAEHLRYAADSLAKITGQGSGADVDDVLGVVFEK